MPHPSSFFSAQVAFPRGNRAPPQSRSLAHVSRFKSGPSGPVDRTAAHPAKAHLSPPRADTTQVNIRPASPRADRIRPIHLATSPRERRVVVCQPSRGKCAHEQGAGSAIHASTRSSHRLQWRQAIARLTTQPAASSGAHTAGKQQSRLRRPSLQRPSAPRVVTVGGGAFRPRHRARPIARPGETARGPEAKARAADNGATAVYAPALLPPGQAPAAPGESFGFVPGLVAPVVGATAVVRQSCQIKKSCADLIRAGLLFALCRAVNCP